MVGSLMVERDPASVDRAWPFGLSPAFIWFSVYCMLWRVGAPFVWLYLLKRSIGMPAYRKHWFERLGLYGTLASRPQKSAWIWIHAVSLGETRAAQSLIERLRLDWPDAGILLTHGTPTGRLAGEGLCDAQVYLPYEWSGSIRRFLRFWKPSLGLIMETEVWPVLCQACKEHQVPVVLVNGRLSERSLKKARRYAPLIAPALAQFSGMLVQTEADAQRLRSLSPDLCAIQVTGNLKFDIELDPLRLLQGEQWRQGFRASRPAAKVIVAASTREGEEDLLIACWRAYGCGQREGLLLVIVPRHPQRFSAVSLAVSHAGFDVIRRSEPDFQRLFEPGGTDSLDAIVVIGDSIGEMASWYRFADVVIMGGSLAGRGSQNLIEPCSAGCPVILGPSIYNFEQAASQALSAGAAIQVQAKDAVSAAYELLLDPVRCQRMAHAAFTFSKAHRGAAARSADYLKPMIKAFSSGPQP
ncbi:MAG: 3-deoxy-D-manno-octulosonic acid transferase [Betaproteobacteria bacterium]|nr:3-deoxy-D-manno-octulosonic acid transferase [Betaproteobacteria bacterium]